MKRITAVVMAVLMAFFMSGCKFFGSDFSSLLLAPKAPSELNEIQNTFLDSINGDYNIEYPTSGDYRNGMLQFDLDGDGLREVFIFYSTANDDGTKTMHLSFLALQKGEWQLCSDLQVVASGVKFIEFYDLNNNGVFEVVAGWDSYLSGETVLTVYCLESGSLIQRMRENALAYCVYDPDDDDRQEILVLGMTEQQPAVPDDNSMPVVKVANASLYKFNANEISLIGRCSLDSTVESYGEPREMKLNTKTQAVIIDGRKPNGSMLTEAVVWDGKKLSNPFFNEEIGRNIVTYRDSSISSLDWNGDGIVEIPSMRLLPSITSDGDNKAVYLTCWMQYKSAGAFARVGSSIINTVDNYYVDIPDEWENKITVVRKVDKKQRIVYLWDEENMILADEIFRVQVFTRGEWEKEVSSPENTLVELTRDETNVYVGSVNEAPDGDIALTIKELKNSFHLILSNKGE